MRVTIGVSFYNCGPLLAATLQSVFAQTLPDWALLLVDDGSTDSSPAIAEAVDDPRVFVISDGMNQGLPARRNLIASLAQSEYLVYLDADDLMHPRKLAEQVAYLDAHPAIDVVGTAVYTIDDKNELTGIRHRFPLIERPGFVLRHGVLMQCSIMGRTRWFRENPYDEAFRRAQDHELWCRTHDQGVFGKIEEPLLFYREAHRPPARYLKLYLQSCHYNRLIFRRYGPEMVGWPQTGWLIAKTYLKALAYGVTTRLGRQEWLVRRRNHPLSVAEAHAAKEALKIILNTPVPGLSAASPFSDPAASPVAHTTEPSMLPLA